MHQASGENCSAESLKALTVGHPCCFCRRPHFPQPTSFALLDQQDILTNIAAPSAEVDGVDVHDVVGDLGGCMVGVCPVQVAARRAAPLTEDSQRRPPPPLATSAGSASIKHLAVCVRNSDSSNNTKIQLAVGEQWCSTTSSLSLSFSFSHPTEPVPFLSASIFSPMAPLVMIPPPLRLSHRRAPLLLSVTRRALSG